MAIKRTLTTLQITQFLVGASYAMVHSFVSYTVPVTVSLQNPAAAAAAATPMAGRVLESLKSMAAAVTATKSSEAAAGPTAAAAAAVEQQTVYTVQPCVTTSGETFAIWLNVLYLAPLTYLFAKFFVASYLRRSSAEQSRIRPKGARRMSHATLAERAGWDAARATQREVYADMSDEAAEDAAARGRKAGAAKVNGAAKN